MIKEAIMYESLDAMLEKALDLNYCNLGALSISKIEDENLKNDILDRFPWAKGIIISPWHYNYYSFPQDLRPIFDKEVIFQGRFIEGTEENLASLSLGDFMENLALNCKAFQTVHKKSLEQLAVVLGLGIIRKNSKFYTEEGSFCNLHAWVVDHGFDFIQEGQAQACPDHCSRCIRQCPVQALTKGYQKDYSLCETYQKKEKSHMALTYKLEKDHDKYLKACNLCLDICPYNQDRWEEAEEYLPFNIARTLTTKEQKIKNIINKMKS